MQSPYSLDPYLCVTRASVNPSSTLSPPPPFPCESARSPKVNFWVLSLFICQDYSKEESLSILDISSAPNFWVWVNCWSYPGRWWQLLRLSGSGFVPFSCCFYQNLYHMSLAPFSFPLPACVAKVRKIMPWTIRGFLFFFFFFYFLGHSCSTWRFPG